MMHDELDLIEATRIATREEVGAEVDGVLDELAEDPVMQSDLAQLVLDKVRRRFYQLFEHEWDAGGNDD